MIPEILNPDFFSLAKVDPINQTQNNKANEVAKNKKVQVDEDDENDEDDDEADQKQQNTVPLNMPGIHPEL